MKILVACEESQAVTIELRKLGHEAFSCDLLPCSGGHFEWHIIDDITTVINNPPFITMDANRHVVKKWDIIIAFPPCTHLTLAGAKHFKKKRESGVQEENIKFFFELWKIADCLENPMGIMNGGKYIEEWFPKLYKEMVLAKFPFAPTQIIQPFMFGDPVKKTTCLWLKGLPKLKETNNVESDVKYYVSEKGAKMSEWYAKQIVVDGKKYGYGSEEFKKHRSKTFAGIAKAMATQWTKEVLVNDLFSNAS
jgi:hypothetical protein